MAAQVPGAVTAAALEELLATDYAGKDTMHDLTHIRRVHRAAVRLAREVFDELARDAGLDSAAPTVRP